MKKMLLSVLEVGFTKLAGGWSWRSKLNVAQYKRKNSKKNMTQR